MIGFRKSSLLGVSTAAMAIALSGGAEAVVLPLPVVNPNFEVTSANQPKDLWGQLTIPGWTDQTILNRPSAASDLTGINGPLQGTVFGKSSTQPFGVYGNGYTSGAATNLFAPPPTN